MNRTLITAVVLLAFVPAGAVAQERAGDAALGAVSGAVVLGPVGAVAGALIGYAAGPSIARSWGVRGSRSASSRRRPRGEASRATSYASRPPTQEAMDANGSVAQMAPANTPPAQTAPATPAAPTQTSMPAAQGFE
jgi:hypothetical protein